jgi:hypothetical protein
MTRALLPFDKRKVAKPSPRKAQSKVYSSISRPSFEKARAAAQKLRAGSKRPNKVNRKRKVSEFARVYGSRQRVAWVKRRPCLVANDECRQYAIENAHVTDDGTKGMGRKSGYRCIAPLCHLHHRWLHIQGATWFEERYGVSLAFAAAQTELAFLAFGERAE